jgi:EAL domain-containing protein (putative c-di-GMP-specific phosphodiesterase class I)
MSATTNRSQVAPELQRLPNLTVILRQIARQLVERLEIGILSITVIRRRERDPADSWEDYDRTLREISIFLEKFRHGGLRRSDILLEPILAGNTLMVLLGPPRDGGPLHVTALNRVWHRLKQGLATHLAQRLSHTSRERFGVYVGRSLMRHDPTLRSDLIIYRALEAAIADALGQQQHEARLHASHLRQILEGSQIVTLYQPVVDLVEHRVIGFEALTRLPQEQFETPDLLFKVANEQGVLWELERLCRQRALQKLPPLERDQALFLNIEPDSIYDPQLRQEGFLEDIRKSGLEPSSVVLEITEHAAVREFELLRRALDDVRGLGFRLSMDDVGSGYSGLQVIAEMRPDFIKADMALVRDMHLDPFKRELMATIHRFTENSGIVLVAEGVQCVAELKSLAEAGVRCAQGFLFARPGSPPEEPDWSWLSKLPY